MSWNNINVSNIFILNRFLVVALKTHPFALNPWCTSISNIHLPEHLYTLVGSFFSHCTARECWHAFLALLILPWCSLFCSLSTISFAVIFYLFHGFICLVSSFISAINSGINFRKIVGEVLRGFLYLMGDACDLRLSLKPGPVYDGIGWVCRARFTKCFVNSFFLIHMVPFGISSHQHYNLASGLLLNLRALLLPARFMFLFY